MFLRIWYGVMIPLVMFISVFVQGCAENRAEIEKMVVAQDPSFQGMIEKMNSIRERINLDKQVFLQKKNEIEGRIQVLREEKKKLQMAYSAAIDRLKRQVHPEKMVLEKDLADLEVKYNIAKEALAHVEREIKDVKQLMDKKENIEMSREEMNAWKDRLGYLLKDKEGKILERDGLKRAVEVTKYKIKLLNL